MSAFITSVLIEQNVGIETVLHYACRDRNLIGIQADLLGAQAIGLRNLLLVTGDPPKLGDYPDATAVFDVDSIGLTHVVSRLNHGKDIGGNPIGGPTSFFIGVGVNPGAIDLNYEIRRFEYKVKAGAEFAITQPMYNQEILSRFLERIQHVRIPILAGIWPLTSYRNAQFLNTEVPGAEVPAEIMERMSIAEGQGRGKEEGIEIAREAVEKIKGIVDGIQISAPFGRVKTVMKVLEAFY
jgi:homocysteine S-methyltransferase